MGRGFLVLPSVLPSGRSLRGGSAQLGGGACVDRAVGPHGNPKQRSGFIAREVAAGHVAGDLGRGAREGIAVSTAAGRQHLHAVTGPQRDVLVLRQVLGQERFPAAVHARAPGQDTPFRAVNSGEPAGLAVGWTEKAVPFQRSARGKTRVPR